MPSSFLGLYVQREALLISQKALDITGNNISNINTPGYSRQRVDICSIANSKGTLGYDTSISLAGMGSEAVGVAQIRDRLLDNKVRVYSGDLCDVGIKVNTLSDVEDVFDSIEADELDASFASIVNKFKEALQSFSADHADRSEMANIAKNSAESVVKCIVNYNMKLNDISEQTLSEASSTVKRINAIFAEMGSLNNQIKDSYISMGYIHSTAGNYEVLNDYGPLELKDKMHSLLDELAQYGNIYVTEMDDGTFTVDFAGQRVVEGKKYAQMATTQEKPDPTQLEFIISKIERDANDKIISGLYDKDDWYDLNVKYETGGNTQLLVRNDKAGDTINITGDGGLGTGKQLLDSGSLRGYLDVYNGRGEFAKNSGYINDKYTAQNVDAANEALSKLADYNNGVDIGDTEKLIKQLETVGATVNFSAADNKYSVEIGGAQVLDGTTVTDITVAQATPHKTIENYYNGIEYYRDMLNSFVRTMTDEFNKAFALDTDGNPLTDSDGNPIELFTYENDDGVADFREAAANFRVADCWNKNPEIISNPKGDNQFEELNNVYINRLLGIFSSDQEYGDGFYKDPQKFSLEKFVSHICDNLGTQVEHEKGVYDANDIMLTSVEKARSEVMDVSMGEEGINMMNYQKWYNAISRMISTMDEALDKLINNTGIVGLR